ncbi:MAG: hypothetical protein RRZ65_10315, partial [Tannerellaceae bacterium]
NIDEALNKGRYEGLAEGLAKGLAEGEAKSQRLIASNMKSKGVPVDVIAECTKLSIEEIEKM